MEPRQKLRFIPIGYKMMLSYCLLIVVPLVTVVAIASTIYVTSIREQTKNNINGTLQQITDNITYKLDAAIHTSRLLYHDSKLIFILKQKHEGWDEYDNTANYLLPKLQDTIKSSNLPALLSFYIHNKTLYEVYSLKRIAVPYVLTNGSFDLYYIDRIKDTAWYMEFPAEEYGHTMRWAQIEDDAEHGLISLLRRVVDVREFRDFKELAFMRITYNLSDLFHSVDSEKIGEGSSIYIVNEQGEIVYSSGELLLAAPNQIDSDYYSEHIVLEESLPYLNWKLITLIPTTIIEKDIDQVRTVTVIVGIACLIVFIMVGYFLSGYFSKRVGKIVSVLSAFREGEFHKRMNYKGNDEFGMIAKALNDMGKDTEALIDEVYLTNIEKKEAELESLQSQINPHFLYNTLSSISSLAKFGEVEKLNRMVIDLSKFYRLTLNDGKHLILLRDEWAQAQAYINIQRTKYGEQLQAWYDIDPDALDCETIKLILQPIIENVFEHAWTESGVRMRVIIQKADKKVVIKIIDDGYGMHPDTIRQIFDPLDQLNVGIGIRNVDQRIKLHYGKPYGVSIFSKLGIGTTVLIIIPANPPISAK
ncbi:sensor histidine kinase [Paenibacillus sp. GXUN7292]|uniref:sensor histidine kinase n=1 Tax=Paenibacillus sp. GXUN7292 TaxID=3422499 RepID=UPI003D7EAA16